MFMMSRRTVAISVVGQVRLRWHGVKAALPKKYEHARTQIPFAVIVGNHDRRTPMRKIFPDPSYGPGDNALNSTRSVRKVGIEGPSLLHLHAWLRGAVRKVVT